MIVATIEQKIILPYRQVDDYSTAPYVYATLLSEDQMLLFNYTSGRFEIKTLSILGHSHAFSSITNKPTTIGGYGITDAYTKTQTDNLLSGIMTNVYTKQEVDNLLSGVTIDAYTKQEMQNFFAGSASITGYNKSNWDTAYQWGNHAGLYSKIALGLYQPSQGFLIQTNIIESTDTSVELIITGSRIDDIQVLFTIVNFRHGSVSFSGMKAMGTGNISTIYLFDYNGYLYIWIPPIAALSNIRVQCFASNSNIDRVVNIIDSTLPSGRTKEQIVAPLLMYNSGNCNKSDVPWTASIGTFTTSIILNNRTLTIRTL